MEYICEAVRKEYASLLEEAAHLTDDIFNLEKIFAQDAKYDLLSEKNRERIRKAWAEIKEDAACKEYCYVLLCFMQKGLDIGCLKPPEDSGIKGEFALFFPVWHMMGAFAADAEKRGVPHSILHTTLRAVDSCIERNAGFCGRYGTSAFHSWMPLYGQGKLFRMFGFEFEIRTFRGQDAIGVHIPSGTKLDVKENLASFRAALDFFETYYKEYKMAGFVCESWLLNPHIEEIMGKKTNISRFGDMFRRFDIGDTEGKSVYRFVFGLLAPAEADTLCENTSLQKNMKAYLAAGKKVVNYGGFLSAEKLRGTTE